MKHFLHVICEGLPGYSLSESWWCFILLNSCYHPTQNKQQGKTSCPLRALRISPSGGSWASLTRTSLLALRVWPSLSGCRAKNFICKGSDSSLFPDYKKVPLITTTSKKCARFSFCYINDKPMLLRPVILHIYTVVFFTRAHSTSQSPMLISVRIVWPILFKYTIYLFLISYYQLSLWKHFTNFCVYDYYLYFLQAHFSFCWSQGQVCFHGACN